MGAANSPKRFFAKRDFRASDLAKIVHEEFGKITNSCRTQLRSLL